MKLYYANFSPQSRAVLMTIRNLNIDVEVIHINFAKGENKTEEFLKLNPLGQVPVLVDDDGFILSESRAIAAYLVVSRNPTSSLYPMNNSTKRSMIDEKLLFDAEKIFQSHVQILHPMIANGDPLISDEKKKILRSVLSTLDSFLKDNKWIVDDSTTIADFFILSNFIVILCAGVCIDNYKYLSAWYERCKKLKGLEENYRGGQMVSELLKMRNLPPISLE